MGVSSFSAHEVWLLEVLNEYGYPNVIRRYPTALMAGDIASLNFDHGYASVIPTNDGNPVASTKDKNESTPKLGLWRYRWDYKGTNGRQHVSLLKSLQVDGQR